MSAPGRWFWCVDLPNGRRTGGAVDTEDEARAIVAEYQCAAEQSFRHRAPRGHFAIPDGSNSRPGRGDESA